MKFYLEIKEKLQNFRKICDNLALAKHHNCKKNYINFWNRVERSVLQIE